ncbi:class I SAM-dependent methyltransferase [Salegentibacter agarivorans]
MHSPIYKGGRVDRIDVFKSSQIVEAYNSIGMDVSRFFKEIEKIELLECKRTGYRFYYPLSVNGDADFYKELSTKRENYYSKRWEHLKVLPSIHENEHVLEIGSGFGAFLTLLKLKNIKAEGLELNPKAIEICRKKGLIINNMPIEELSIKSQKCYDVVCYFQVLEHITNVHDFINNSLIALKPNGKLIIGVPNNNPFLFINDKYHTLNLPPHHAGLWNKKALKSLEALFNIKLLSLQYEPLERTYYEFLKTYIKNSNPLYSKILRMTNKISPKILKFILCKFINGRNILAVFEKRG